MKLTHKDSLVGQHFSSFSHQNALDFISQVPHQSPLLSDVLGSVVRSNWKANGLERLHKNKSRQNTSQGQKSLRNRTLGPTKWRQPRSTWNPATLVALLAIPLTDVPESERSELEAAFQNGWILALRLEAHICSLKSRKLFQRQSQAESWHSGTIHGFLQLSAFSLRWQIIQDVFLIYHGGKFPWQILWVLWSFSNRQVQAIFLKTEQCQQPYSFPTSLRGFFAIEVGCHRVSGGAVTVHNCYVPKMLQSLSPVLSCSTAERNAVSPHWWGRTSFFLSFRTLIWRPVECRPNWQQLAGTLIRQTESPKGHLPDQFGVYAHLLAIDCASLECTRVGLSGCLNDLQSL